MSEDEGLLCACDRRGGQLHDYGSECGPRVYPARPESPGLPPVGELVQITVQDADGTATGLAQFRTDRTRFDSLDWPPGIPVGLVTSWCPVLVLPDTDEALVDLIGSRIASIDGYTPEQWAGFRAVNPNWLRSRPAYKAAEAVLSALREAAIR